MHVGSSDLYLLSFLFSLKEQRLQISFRLIGLNGSRITGDEWKARRKAIAPAFTADVLQGNVLSAFNDVADELVRYFTDSAGAEVDAEGMLQCVALENSARTIFSTTFGPLGSNTSIVEAIDTAFYISANRNASILPKYWQWPLADKILPEQRQFRECMLQVERLLAEFVQTSEQRIASNPGEMPTNVLDVLVSSQMDKDLNVPTDPETQRNIRNDLIALWSASVETTASAMAWSLYLAASHPEETRPVQCEIDSVLGSRDYVTMDDIRALRRTRALLMEGMRLMTGPPVFFRKLCDDFHARYSGITIPAGETLIIASQLIHRDKRIFGSDPHCFRPSRWEEPWSADNELPGFSGYEPSALDASDKSPLYPTETKTGYSFLPFAAGRRRCMGDTFAVQEGTITLAKLLKALDFEPANAVKDPQHTMSNVSGKVRWAANNGLPLHARPRYGYTSSS